MLLFKIFHFFLKNNRFALIIVKLNVILNKITKCFIIKFLKA
jgi:hypothetical protein